MLETYNRWDPLGDGSTYAGPPLRNWQVSALEEWERSGHRGVVEAVTGTGKSLVGVAAIHEVLALGGVALVVVPTRALVVQWSGNLRRELPRARLGTISDGGKTDFRQSNVIVATVQSLFRTPLKGTSLTLLVADEVHRYGSPQYAKALRSDYEWRLGLTGTYERTGEDGVERLLSPYFGATVYEYSYGQALADGVVAPFDLAFVGVEFVDREKADFQKADELVQDATYRLRKNYLYPDEWSDFFAKVTATLKEGVFDQEGSLCQQYIKGFSERKRILATAEGKLKATEALAPHLGERSGTLIFTESKDSATRHAWVASKSTSSWPLDGDSSAEIRAEKLRSFGQGKLKIIAAPRILDEGIDVPEAEVAVVVSASQSRRQMIQRMGRVIRKKEDGRGARMIMMYVQGTSEDPNLGAHEAFLDEVKPHASSVSYFSSTEINPLGEWILGI
jgi:RNA polymerase primary sigma factor